MLKLLYGYVNPQNYWLGWPVKTLLGRKNQSAHYKTAKWLVRPANQNTFEHAEYSPFGTCLTRSGHFRYLLNTFGTLSVPSEHVQDTFGTLSGHFRYLLNTFGTIERVPKSAKISVHFRDSLGTRSGLVRDSFGSPETVPKLNTISGHKYRNTIRIRDTCARSPERFFGTCPRSTEGYRGVPRGTEGYRKPKKPYRCDVFNDFYKFHRARFLTQKTAKLYAQYKFIILIHTPGHPFDARPLMGKLNYDIYRKKRKITIELVPEL